MKQSVIRWSAVAVCAAATIALTPNSHAWADSSGPAPIVRSGVAKATRAIRPSYVQAVKRSTECALKLQNGALFDPESAAPCVERDAKRTSQRTTLERAGASRLRPTASALRRLAEPPR